MSEENANKKMKYDKVEAKDNMKKEEIEDEVVKPGNKKKLDKVVTKEVSVEKKSLTSRFIKGVAGPEGFTGIWEYTVEEVVVPSIKNIVMDTFTGTLGMIQESIVSTISYKLFGDKGPPVGNNFRHNTGPQVGYKPRTNYQTRPDSHGRVERPAVNDPRIISRDRERPLSFSDYIIEDREDAANTLFLMTEYADKYGQVSVAEYYELIGVGMDPTDYGYGWLHEEIMRATMRPTAGGFIIQFPPALPL